MRSTWDLRLLKCSSSDKSKDWGCRDSSRWMHRIPRYGRDCTKDPPRNIRPNISKVVCRFKNQHSILPIITRKTKMQWKLLPWRLRRISRTNRITTTGHLRRQAEYHFSKTKRIKSLCAVHWFSRRCALPYVYPSLWWFQTAVEPLFSTQLAG